MTSASELADGTAWDHEEADGFTVTDLGLLNLTVSEPAPGLHAAVCVYAAGTWAYAEYSP